MADTLSSSSEGEAPNKQSRAAAISGETWELHEAEIEDIYITQKRSFKQLMRHMARRGFAPSEQQYRAKLREWGIYKNNLKRTKIRGESLNGGRAENTNKTRRIDAVQPQPAPAQQPAAERTSDQQAPTQPILVEQIPAQGNHAGQDAAQKTATLADPELFVDNTWTQAGTQMANNSAENWYRHSAFVNGSSLEYNSSIPISPTFTFGYAPSSSGRFLSIHSLGGPPFLQRGLQHPIWESAYEPVHDGYVYGMDDFHSTGDTRWSNTGFQHHVNLNASLPSGTISSNNKEAQPIHIAASGGNTQVVEWILETEPQCADAEAADGSTPIMRAAEEGHIKIVKLLCNMKANVNATRDCGRKAIHQAAQQGHTAVVNVLLQNGSEHDSVDIQGVTPFWSACQGGHKDIVQILLEKGVNTEQIADNGRTPIHQAAQNNHLEIVKILLDLNVSIDPTNNGDSPLWSAAQNGHLEIVKLLLKKGADSEAFVKESSRRAIHQAAQNGHSKVVKALLQAGALVSPEKDSFDSTCPSPLYLAAQSGHYGVVNILLKYEADPNFASLKTGYTALIAAVADRALKTAELLLERGAEVDGPETDGWRPLMFAAQNGDSRMTHLLLSRGATVDGAEKDGATALWIAAQQGNAAIVSMLLAAKAKSLSTKKSGRRPIHQAAQNGHFAVVKLLVEHDENEAAVTDSRGATPIALAAGGKEANRLSMMQYLHLKGGTLTQVS